MDKLDSLVWTQYFDGKLGHVCRLLKGQERCRIGRSFGDSEIPLLSSSLYLFEDVEGGFTPDFLFQVLSECPSESKTVSGGAGVEYLSNNNAGFLRQAKREQKSRGTIG